MTESQEPWRPPKILLDALDAIPCFEEPALLHECARQAGRALRVRIVLPETSRRRVMLLFLLREVMAHPDGLQVEIERRLGRMSASSTGSEQLRREVDLVNAALVLRRPLLVTGRPGTGKSPLAYRISRELRLGRVLRWHITSRTTLRGGLYEYDAIGRVQDSAALHTLHRSDGAAAGAEPQAADEERLPGIGDYLQLGPLGTALLPHELPRVLLVDELDKSDQDLANDLLSVFEEGQFPITELARARRLHPKVTVMTDDPGRSAEIVDGIVKCRAFPVVVITSNGEREFPPAFLRRCLRLRMPDPDRPQLVTWSPGHPSGSTRRAARDRHWTEAPSKRPRTDRAGRNRSPSQALPYRGSSP
ncbi:AAA family ATPase [Streptomyces sp. NPDC048254]|uniref:effector-associated domain 2-containing protein n=1 Tax=Streptomyces sp. NPDC048254 TaxID=3365525 RepID=UPI00371107E7